MTWGTFYFDYYSANSQNTLIYLAPSLYKMRHRCVFTYKYLNTEHTQIGLWMRLWKFFLITCKDNSKRRVYGNFEKLIISHLICISWVCFCSASSRSKYIEALTAYCGDSIYGTTTATVVSFSVNGLTQFYLFGISVFVKTQRTNIFSYRTLFRQSQHDVFASFVNIRLFYPLQCRITIQQASYVITEGAIIPLYDTKSYALVFV